MHNISNLEIHVRVVYSSGHLRKGIVWFQKISILPPPPPHGRTLEIPRGRGGGKGSNFQGVGGFMGNYFSKWWRTTYKTLKATYDRKLLGGGRGGHQRPLRMENPRGWEGCKSKSLLWRGGYGYFLEPHIVKGKGDSQLFHYLSSWASFFTLNTSLTCFSLFPLITFVSCDSLKTTWPLRKKLKLN